MSKKEQKYSELAGMPKDELVKKLGQYKKEQFNLRFQQTLGELKNTARFSLVRKQIARIKTCLTNMGSKNA